MYGIYTNLGGILMVNVTIYIYISYMDIYIAYMDLVLILVIILL